MITARAATVWDIEGCAYGYIATSCQAHEQTNEWKNTNFMANLLKNANFNIECDCTKLWTDEVFADVLAGRHRTIYEFKTRVTYDCLNKILSWSHSKMLEIKGFTEKKLVVLNDDEPRPIPIPKDFAHLMLRKIDEAYIEFIQCRSVALVEMSEYTLKSKFLQVKHLNRTLRCVIF